MKIASIIFVLGLASYSSAVESNTVVEDIGYFQTMAIDFISSQASMDCPQSSGEKLKEAKEQAIECVKNIKQNNSFCYTFINHFKPCVQVLLDEAKKCVNTTATAFRNTVFDSFIEEARYICNVDGEHILEITNPCVLKSLYLSRECRGNLTKPLGHTRDPAVICSVSPPLQKCFEQQMEHECENEFTRNTVHDFISVDVKPCNIAMQLYFGFAQYLSFLL